MREQHAATVGAQNPRRTRHMTDVELTAKTVRVRGDERVHADAGITFVGIRANVRLERLQERVAPVYFTLVAFPLRHWLPTLKDTIVVASVSFAAPGVQASFVFTLILYTPGFFGSALMVTR